MSDENNENVCIYQYVLISIKNDKICNDLISYPSFSNSTSCFREDLIQEV